MPGNRWSDQAAAAQNRREPLTRQNARAWHLGENPFTKTTPAQAARGFADSYDSGYETEAASDPGTQPPFGTQGSIGR